MSDYTPNSNRFKEQQKNAASEEKRVSKVVKGNVKIKKKSEFSKFTDVFIPGAKKIIRDVLVEGVDMMFGTTGRGSRKSDGPTVSYVKFYDKDRRPDSRPHEESHARSRFDYGSLVFESRGEAQAVLDEMDNVLDTYKFVSVADLYDMASLTPPFTSNKFGWTNISTAEIVRVSDGYIIKLPKAQPLD